MSVQNDEDTRVQTSLLTLWFRWICYISGPTQPPPYRDRVAHMSNMVHVLIIIGG